MLCFTLHSPPLSLELETYTWIQVNEQGSGDIFPPTTLAEKSIEGAALSVLVGESRVGMTICFKTVLEEVAGKSILGSARMILDSWH